MHKLVTSSHFSREICYMDCTINRQRLPYSYSIIGGLLISLRPAGGYTEVWDEQPMQ